jgi:uncharacterized membrane protein
MAHFIDPEPFLAIVPPALPGHAQLVFVSGLCEVAGGLGLLIPRVRRAAGWGLLALLLAVYPANIHMALNEVYLPDMPRQAWLLWARLPFQFLFAAMVCISAGFWPRRDAQPSHSPDPEQPPTESRSIERR